MNSQSPFGRVLITGGAGFIGSHLADELVSLGVRVTVLDNLSTGSLANLNPRVEFVEGDITLLDDVTRALSSRPDVIFHLAADARTRETEVGWRVPQAVLLTNVLGTVNLLEAAVSRHPFPRFVFASSAAVYGRLLYVPVDENHSLMPLSPYGVSKLSGEYWCRAYWQGKALDLVIVRLFNIYGPRQRRYVMYDLLAKIKQRPLSLDVVGDGEQVRDYCYVADAVEGLILAAKAASPGTVLNLSGNSPLRIREVVDLLLEVEGLESVAVRFMGSSWRGDVHEMVANTAKLRELGFDPTTSLRDGLTQLSKWLAQDQAKREEDR